MILFIMNIFFRYTDNFLIKSKLDEEISLVFDDPGKVFLVDIGRLSHCSRRV